MSITQADLMLCVEYPNLLNFFLVANLLNFLVGKHNFNDQYVTEKIKNDMCRHVLVIYQNRECLVSLLIE